MAKKMRKLLALVLALALIVGQLAIPAMAETTSDDGNAAASADAGSGDGSDTTYYTDPNTGATGTTTVTHTTDPSTGASTSSTHTTETKTETTSAGSVDITKTESSSDWESTSNTPIAGSGEPDGEGFTSQGGTETTTISGGESSYHELVQDEAGRPLSESERSEGEESSTTTTTDTKEKTETVKYDDTDITNNAYEKDEEKSSTGTYENEEGTGSEGKTEDAKITQDPGDVTLELTPGKSDQRDVSLDMDQLVNDNMSLPKEGKSETVKDNVTTITTVTYTKDASGNIIGYTTTTETITTNVKEDQEYTEGNSVSDLKTEVDYDTGDSTKVTYEMPAKTEGGIFVNPDGSTTVITVEEIYEELPEGVSDQEPALIGYRTVKVTTSADGLEKTTETQEDYRTKITTEIDTTTTDVTTTTYVPLTKERVTETNYVRYYGEDDKELVIRNGKWVYAATMSDVEEGTDNGKLNITSLTPSSIVIDGVKYGVVDRGDSVIPPVKEHDTNGYEFTYTGVRGEGSNYDVNYANGGTTPAHMFELAYLDENGNEQTFFVYCLDLATTAIPEFNYTIENINDADYYQGENAREHIEAIGLYGYWGILNEEGATSATYKTGSLEKLIDNLLEAKKAGDKSLANVTETQIKALTHGEALTATQAAFWKYGNAGSTKIADDQKTAMITAVYQWLINQEVPDTKSTDLIDADEFAQTATITVKDKVYENGMEKTETITDDSGAEVTKTYYNTDVSFTIDVQASVLTGNMIIKLMQNGKEVDSINLATDKSNWLGKLTADETNNSSIVTFKNVELLEGVTFDITISGTQELEAGVYIYSSEQYYSSYKGGNVFSQTFVGLASGSQEVDLSVSMSFTVSDPEVSVKTLDKKNTQTKQDILVETKSDLQKITRTDRTTNVETTVTKENQRNWLKERIRDWAYEYETELHMEKGGTTILDEEVPLADAPKTGDISGLWAAISLISLGGVALLNRKRKEEI